MGWRNLFIFCVSDGREVAAVLLLLEIDICLASLIA